MSGPLMYKQRPAYPALIAAVVVLAFGAFVVWNQLGKVEDGLAEPSSAVAAGCFSCGIAAACIVAAFARYQFTHLWKKPDPAFSRKQKKLRKNQRPRS
jgi:hypothetical protein